MTLPVVLSADAEAEMLQAALWHEQKSVGLGFDFVARVREMLVTIADAPRLFPEIHGTTRRAPVQRFRYGIYYRIGDERVEVIAVFHESRDPTIWQNRS